jgi:hypothetical protein
MRVENNPNFMLYKRRYGEGITWTGKELKQSYYNFPCDLFSITSMRRDGVGSKKTV